MSAKFKPEHLARIIEITKAGYPDETCGLIVGKNWDEAKLVEMDNVYDRYAKADPERFTRSARTAYMMDPLKQMKAVDEGGGLLSIWHSHCDMGAYFSDEDVAVALGGGDEPFWPGTSYLVVSCRANGVDAAKVFEWNAETRTFDGQDVALPES